MMMTRRSIDTAGTASLPYSHSGGSHGERRLSVFEMLHKNIPRTPDSSRTGELWQVPSQVEGGEGEGEEQSPSSTAAAAAAPTNTTAKGRNSKHQHPVLANRRSIYGLQRESIASRGLPVPTRPPPPAHLHLLPSNSQQEAERSYVKNSRLKDNPAETFTHQIMQNFFKAPKGRNRGYGMPRPETREGSATNQAMMQLSRKPSFVRVPSHVSLCQPVRCHHHRGLTEEYCEILGPGCCSSCIETTNRHIAEEIQRRLFPSIEVTQSCLVVPALTKVMKDGHVRQVRRRRLNELRRSEPGCEFAIPKSHREEVTSETCTCFTKMRVMKDGHVRQVRRRRLNELRRSEPGYPPLHRSRQPLLNSKSLFVWGPKNTINPGPPLPAVRASRPDTGSTVYSV